MPPVAQGPDTVDQTVGGAAIADRPVPGVVLVWSDATAYGVPVAVDSAPLVVGRGLFGATTLDDTRMSRRHAEVAREDGQWRVTDLDSRNGSALDGAPLVGTRRVSGAAVLRTGHTLFLLTEDVRSFGARATPAPDGTIVGPTLARAWAGLDEAAGSSHVVHVHGETGAGKELAARRFHTQGPRKSGPFVAVNCATIPAALAERLLFGAKKGAYSGAEQDADGYFVAADGGTLFLDEVEELDLQVQAKLLRVLETSEVTPLGANKARRIDFGLVTATHGDLRARMSEGKFRPDLYFRLGRPAVTLPSLRERREDIPALIAAALAREEDPRVGHSSLVEAALLRPWPGNVRELLLEVREASRAARRRSSRRVEADDLGGQSGKPPAAARASGNPAPPAPSAIATPVPSSIDEPAPRRTEPLSADDAVLRDRVVAALRDARGNVSSAARALDVHRTQLRRWITRFGISAEED